LSSAVLTHPPSPVSSSTCPGVLWLFALGRLTPPISGQSELWSITCCNLLDEKNDQFRKGSWVFIACSSTPPCPVAVVKKFLWIGGHRKGSKLFRRVQSIKRGVCLRDQPMSYSRAKELFRKELEREGLNPSLFGVHSLRSGGASAAAALGVPARLFQRHGGWRSKKAMNNYVEESLDSLLLVPQSMLQQ